MHHANGDVGVGAGAKLGRSQPANAPPQILQNFPIMPCSNFNRAMGWLLEAEKAMPMIWWVPSTHIKYITEAMQVGC